MTLLRAVVLLITIPLAIGQQLIRRAVRKHINGDNATMTAHVDSEATIPLAIGQQLTRHEVRKHINGDNATMTAYVDSKATMSNAPHLLPDDGKLIENEQEEKALPIKKCQYSSKNRQTTY